MTTYNKTQENILRGEIEKLRREKCEIKEKIQKIKKTRLFFSNKYVKPETTVSNLLCSITTEVEYCDNAIDFWGSYCENTKEYKKCGYEENENLCFADDIMSGNDHNKQYELLDKLNEVYDQNSGIDIQYFDICDVL